MRLSAASSSPATAARPGSMGWRNSWSTSLCSSRGDALKTLELLSLKGKTALITGGSRGLGLQMAEALGEMGAKIAITARKKDELDEAVSHLRKMDIQAEAYVCDVGKREQIAPLA